MFLMCGFIKQLVSVNKHLTFSLYPWSNMFVFFEEMLLGHSLIFFVIHTLTQLMIVNYTINDCNLHN